MMPATPLLLTLYCLAIFFASLLGGRLPQLVALTHFRMQALISLISGVMLGIASLHLLPHAIQQLPSAQHATGAMLAGLLVMFFVLRLLHFHHHEVSADQGRCTHGDQGSLPVLAHHHADEPDHPHPHAGPHQFNWVGLFTGLAVHSLLDGLALGASMIAESSTGHLRFAPGLGTFLAVALHKPLDSLSIAMLMRSSHWSARNQMLVNLVFSLVCPLGALLFWGGAARLELGSDESIGWALAFSAGFFICIALSDLLPEVTFHSHDRGRLSAALLLGIGLAVGVEFLHHNASAIPIDLDVPVAAPTTTPAATE